MKYGVRKRESFVKRGKDLKKKGKAWYKGLSKWAKRFIPAATTITMLTGLYEKYGDDVKEFLEETNPKE